MSEDIIDLSTNEDVLSSNEDSCEMCVECMLRECAAEGFTEYYFDSVFFWIICIPRSVKHIKMAHKKKLLPRLVMLNSQ